MNKSYFLNQRKERVNQLLVLLKDNNKTIPLSRLKGIFSRRTGLSFKKINEYLHELNEGGYINLENGELVWNKENDLEE